ncbi:MAG: helicase C-terminal domain-containing protein [Opitutaceae bacterium]|jgi:ATP-dependent DNA helicase DinG
MIGLREDSETSPPPPAPSRVRELAARVFAEGGLLEKGLSLEHRPEQETMARTVASAMNEDKSLLFEAGTGVGKSLAYLVPGIIHACDQKRQLVVSTHTISLQEQLEQKDLPICRRLFSSSEELKPYAGFRSAVLVGKGNYLCTTRLALALAGKNELFTTPEFAELQRIAEWANTTETGIRHELSPPPVPEVWEHVNAESAACSRKNCDGEHCFYQRARARIRQAQVVIVNHSLLFALLNAGGAREKTKGRGVLFPDDIVILDEAHTVPEVATEHFGLRVSSYGLERLLKYLYNPRTRKGLLARYGEKHHHQLVLDTLESCTQFFGFLADTLLATHPIVRVREEGVVEPYLNGPLLALSKALESIATKLQEGKEYDDINEQRSKIDTYRNSIARWLRVDDEDQVYWVERGGKRQQIVTLRTAPIDVGPALRNALFEREVAVICTSATLAVGNEIGTFQHRLGAESARTGIVASPFDFKRHMRVFVASDIPLPSPREAKLALDALADWVRFCALRTAGGSLVLFTSYSDMRQIAAMLEQDFEQAGRPFLLQGAERSRTELAKAMRSHGNAILFGTDSFWTGVDVPGSALSQVIITRLPFDIPTHPVQEARAERIREQGGNPFNELTLPDAVMKFRQGVGRLIRTTKDRGIVTVLDSRILAKSYGQLFLAALPQQTHLRLTQADREDLFRPYE